MAPNFHKEQESIKLIVVSLIVISMMSMVSSVILASNRWLTHDLGTSSAKSVEEKTFSNGGEKDLDVQDIPESETICTLSVVVCDSENLPHIDITTTRKEGEKRVIRKGATQAIQNKIDYAWSISKDVDFIYTLDVENAGTWDVNILSEIVGANGYRDKGICQFNIGYHPKIVNDKRFSDYQWQIDQCWKHYKGGTRFYGYDVRSRAIKNFHIATN